MKNFYLLAISTLTMSAAIAQPTLTQANSAPLVGETFFMNSFEWDGTEPTAGAGVVWNYSDIETGASIYTEYLEKEDADSYESYPDATLALTSDGLNYGFNEYTSEAQIYHGVYAGGPGVEIVYDDPEVQMVYPMAFGTTNTDSFNGDFVSGGFTISRSGTTTLSAIGYGTLELPDATIENVLLVKMEQDYSDAYAGGTIQYDFVIYQFLRPGWHYPFLTFNVQVIDFGTPIYTGSFNSSESASVKPESEVELSIYPNPVNDLLTIRSSNTEEVKSVSIYTLAGQLVYTEDTFVSNISTAELNAGMYYVEITTKNGTAIEKFVKQ